MVTMCGMDMEVGVATFSWTTKPRWIKLLWWRIFEYHRRRQRQCRTQQQQQQQRPGSRKETRNSTNMASSWCSHKILSPIIPILVFSFLVSSSSLPPAHASEQTGDFYATNQTLRPQRELKKLKFIRARLKNVNKPALKTIQACTKFDFGNIYNSTFLCFCTYFGFVFLLILGLFLLVQSPDGDLIDCVISHLQPAFDHPQLRGQKPLVFSSTSYDYKSYLLNSFGVLGE